MSHLADKLGLCKPNNYKKNKTFVFNKSKSPQCWKIHGKNTSHVPNDFFDRKKSAQFRVVGGLRPVHQQNVWIVGLKNSALGGFVFYEKTRKMNGWNLRIRAPWKWLFIRYQVHPGGLTWNLQKTQLKRKIIFQTRHDFRFELLIFRGCSWWLNQPPNCSPPARRFLAPSESRDIWWNQSKKKRVEYWISQIGSFPQIEVKIWKIFENTTQSKFERGKILCDCMWWDGSERCPPQKKKLEKLWSENPKHIHWI